LNGWESKRLTLSLGNQRTCVGNKAWRRKEQQTSSHQVTPAKIIGIQRTKQRQILKFLYCSPERRGRYENESENKPSDLLDRALPWCRLLSPLIPKVQQKDNGRFAKYYVQVLKKSPPMPFWFKECRIRHFHNAPEYSWLKQEPLLALTVTKQPSFILKGIQNWYIRYKLFKSGFKINGSFACSSQSHYAAAFIAWRSLLGRWSQYAWWFTRRGKKKKAVTEGTVRSHVDESALATPSPDSKSRREWIKASRPI